MATISDGLVRVDEDNNHDRANEGEEFGDGNSQNWFDGEVALSDEDDSDDDMSLHEEEDAPPGDVPNDAGGGGGGGDIRMGESGASASLDPGFTTCDPLDPRRMVLSKEEQERAQGVKAAIEQDKEIDNLSDFAYAQMALMEDSSIDDAMERASKLQSYRQEYKILDTFEDGRRSFKEFVKLFPKAFLSFAYNKRDGNYCLVYDMTAFNLHLLHQPEYILALFRGLYYLCHSLSPDFFAIKMGVIFLVECQDFDWKKNASIAYFQRSWLEILMVYPLQFQKMKYFHTGFFMNMINSLKKRFLPRKITDRIETGCQFDGRLSDVYLVPTVEAARERLLNRLEYTLGLKYENDRAFKLSTS